MSTVSYVDAGSSEIPVPLFDRVVLWNSDGLAFWIDNGRGFSSGTSFTIRAAISEAKRQALRLPPLAPELVDHATESEPVRLSVLVDAATRFGAYTTQAPPKNESALELVAAAAQPGVAFAEWWLPATPQVSIEFHLDYDRADVHVRGMANLASLTGNGDLILKI